MKAEPNLVIFYGAEQAGLMECSFKDEVYRRRTFGIISHPDAGKTTLTEQLLFLGGAIHRAGSIKARKTGRHATSDWMVMEKERGISITSSVMRFKYRGYQLNLLDTPGHQDFSEDTYRVLTAVDSVMMLIDSVKGVESQTKKLMEVCRMRDTPIMTFINKLDREGRAPLDLLSDIRENLQIECAPLSWPIGRGRSFRGTYNFRRRHVHLISSRCEAKKGTRSLVTTLDDPRLDELLGRQAEELRFDVKLIEEAGNTFDLSKYRAGKQTPVFFGCALSGFGVQTLLDAFVEIAPAPQPRRAVTRPVSPYEPSFSGFVFKIQANMDAAHHDRIAFLRVCSGKFEQGMKVLHHRTGKQMRISKATVFMAKDREGADEAYPGDIIGVHNHGTIKIGDTLSEGELLKFTGVPSFTPERFRLVQLDEPLRAKHLARGLHQLSEEGTIQVLRPIVGNDYLLGALGALQFEVTLARLEDEYGVRVHLRNTLFGAARWIDGEDHAKLEAFRNTYKENLAVDAQGDLVYLAESEWWMHRTIQAWPEIEFHTVKEHA